MQALSVVGVCVQIVLWSWGQSQSGAKEGSGLDAKQAHLALTSHNFFLGFLQGTELYSPTSQKLILVFRHLVPT